MKKIFVLLILLYFNPGQAQETEESNLSSLFLHDASRAVKGSVYVLSRPVNWQGSDWFNVAAITGGALTLYFVEKDIRNIFLRNRSPLNDSMSRIGEFYGEPIAVISVTGSIYLYALFTKNNTLRNTAVLMTASLLPAGIIQTTSKMVAGRARPYTGEGHNSFKPFARNEAYYSLVSGHTAVAMSMSLVFAAQFKSMPIKIGSYSLAVLGGLSRIYNDDHWASDILLGAALSYVTFQSATSWLNEKSDRSGDTAKLFLSVSPVNLFVAYLW